MKKASLFTRLIDALMLLAMLALSLATLLALIASDWWLGDLLGHLRVQYALGLLVTIVWFGLRRYWLSLLILLPLLANLSILAPLLLPQPVVQRPSNKSLTILHYNLDKTATNHATVFQFLRTSAPDVLLVQELTPALNKQLAQELPDYRAVYARPIDNTHGSAILLPVTSRLRVLAAAELHLPASSVRPLIMATLDLDGQPLTILSWHVIRPKDAYTEEIQEQEYVAASKWVREQYERQGYPILVIGDYNATPWSARFQRFLQDSGLRDTSLGFGYQPTWPASAPDAFAIPIDHAVISPDIMVLSRTVGPDLGGDHRPLQLEIALPVSGPGE